MWNQTSAQVARVIGPRPKAASGEGEVRLSVSGTAILVAVPTWMRGKMCEFTAVGVGVDVAAGTGSGMTTAVYAQASTVDGTTKAITVSAATGRHIPSGTTRLWYVEPGITHMSVIASGAGTLGIGVASSKVGK